MDTPFTIEVAQRADLDAILAIETACFEGDAFSRKQFVYLLTKAKGVFYVLKQEGKTCAYLSLITNRRTRLGRIYSIAVHPESRGKHFGQALILQAIDYAKQQSLTRVTLEVNTTNRPAIGLYEQQGFVITGLRPQYYHDGSDAFCMCYII